MKVELIKIKFDGEDISYKFKPIKYCCDKLKLNPTIELTVEEDYPEHYCNNCEKRKELIHGEEEICNSCSIYNESPSEDMGLIPGFFIYTSEEIRDWEDYYFREDYYKINFCPHCGEKIEIAIVDEIDANEKYKELKSKRDELNKKKRKTDSKKEDDKLTKEIQQLDNLINDFYYINEYKEELYK